MNFWRHFLCSKVADGLQIYHWNTEEVLEDSDEVSSVLRSFCFISHSTFGIPSCMNYCKLFSIYVFYEKLFKLKQNYPTSEKLTLKYYQYCMIFSVLKPNKIGQLLMAEIKNSLKEDFTGKTSFNKCFRQSFWNINWRKQLLCKNLKWEKTEAQLLPGVLQYWRFDCVPASLPKRLSHVCFSLTFAKTFWKTFLESFSQWLLLENEKEKHQQ